MKNFEFNIHVNNKDFKIFTKPGFFNPYSITCSVHKHNYTEIHLIGNESAEFLVDNKHINVTAEQLLVIPAKTYHKQFLLTDSNASIAFQLNVAVTEAFVCDSIPGIFNNLKKEIQIAQTTGLCGKIPAYLALLCADILNDKTQKLVPVQDRQFIIHEFFSSNYATHATLADLATELNLSLKQTERLVIEYTGNTFRQEIAQKRISAAKHLINTENITLADAAEQVGYLSYSGFWKAFQQSQKMKDSIT